MYAPDDPFAVRRPAPPAVPSTAEATVDEAPVGETTAESVIDEIRVEPRAESVIEETAVEPRADPAIDDAPAAPESFEPDIELLDRAEATYAGTARVIDLVDGGDLDRAESLLDSLVTPSAE
jgi:hypothetical protein